MNKDGHGFFLIHVQKNNHLQTQAKHEKKWRGKENNEPMIMKLRCGQEHLVPLLHVDPLGLSCSPPQSKRISMFAL
jgi:hypothetical protein